MMASEAAIRLQSPGLVVSGDSLRLVAYGDAGYANDELRTTAGMVRKKFGGSIDAALLLGDNFYPRGLSCMEDPQFKRVFQDIIAEGTDYPHFALLGNHDHKGDSSVQLMLHSVDPRWNMPHFFYMQRFRTRSFDACIWFLDTDSKKAEGHFRFSREQAEWLDLSLTEEKSTCRWLIVTAHHPIFTIGEYHDDKHLKENLLPILIKHGVHLYLSGHEHQSQVMRGPQGSTTTFLVAGASSEQRPPYVTRPEHPMFVWSEPKHLAFLVLDFSLERLVFSFHRSTGGRDARPIYTGEIH
jgi:tartrate-resistant acid phosphatase type 5